MLALYELYLLTEIREISMLDPKSCGIVYVDDMSEEENRESAVNLMKWLMPHVEAKNTPFEEWRPSKKHAELGLTSEETAYIDRISEYIQERKKEFPTNCKSTRDPEFV